MLAKALINEAQGISDSIFLIEEVEVISGTPLHEKALNKTTLDLSLIKAGDFDDISNLLSQRSPLFIKSYGPGSLASVSFRGMAASHTRVEWNGIYLNNPMPGQVDFSLLPLFFADEISLLYGGSSLSESSGALGGTVILKTIPIWDDSLAFSISHKTGSFKTNNTMVDIRGGKESFQTRLRLFREKSENDFPYFNSSNGDWNTQIQEDAGYLKTGVLHELHYRSAGADIFSLNTWFQTADRNFPSIMSYEGGGREEKQIDKDLRFSLQWRKYGDRVNTESQLGLNISDAEYFAAEEIPGGMVQLFDSDNSYYSIMARNSTEITLNENLLFRNLIDYAHHEVSSYDRESITGYDNQRTSLGNSFSIHAEISDKISGFSLLRAELNDGKFIPLTPSLGIEISPFTKNNIILLANLSRNYHLPGLNDLYWMPGGNRFLKPERGYSSDFSIQFREEIGSIVKFDSKLNVFYSLIDDWIMWRPGEYGYWTAENIRKVASRGLEYQFSADYNAGILRSEFFVNYSYTKTTNIEDYSEANIKGKQLVYVPGNKGNAFLRLSRKSYYILYNYSFTGKRFTTTSNEDFRASLPAYVLHGLSTGRTFIVEKVVVELNLKVNNLMGINYQTILERAMPGRNYHLTLSLRF